MNLKQSIKALSKYSNVKVKKTTLQLKYNPSLEISHSSMSNGKMDDLTRIKEQGKL